MSFLENTRKPGGIGGKMMVSFMNVGHRALTGWGLRFLHPLPDAHVLDCGCGGGASIKRLLKKCPRGVVKGIDYSSVSVEKTRRVNEPAIAAGRCAVLQGDVANMIFASSWFDLVTAFETVYFWSGLLPAFQEVYRVLKPNGAFLICNECSDPVADKKWTDRIHGMTVYTGEQLKAALEQVGFHHVELHRNRFGWLCVLAQK